MFVLYHYMGARNAPFGKSACKVTTFFCHGKRLFGNIIQKDTKNALALHICYTFGRFLCLFVLWNLTVYDTSLDVTRVRLGFFVKKMY